jgi:CHAT domain-containing protein/tetratricopeptide (TPR) repeat protein
MARHGLEQQQIGELNRQVVQLIEQGTYREALELATHARDLALRVLGDDHETAISLINRGGCLKQLGELQAARRDYEQALRICRILRDNHPVTAHGLNNLGTLVQEMGDLTGARPYLEQALEIRRQMLGNEHPVTITSINNLGVLLQEMGDLAGAWPYLEEALEIRRRVLGNEHPDTAGSLSGLGSLLDDMGDLGAARAYYEHALQIRRRVQGNEHPDTAGSLNNLGYLLQKMADLAGARPYLEEALEVRRRVRGNEHPDTAGSLNNLGYLLHEMGNLSGARLCYEQALVIRRRVLGTNHPQTATTLNNLGGLLRIMGDLAAARMSYEEALAICRHILGNEHPDTAGSLHNLGELEVAGGRIDAAVALMHQASTTDDSMIGQVFSIGADQQRLLFLRQLRGYQDQFLSLICRHLSGSSEAVRTALDLVLRRKALGAEALAVQRDVILGGRYAHLQQGFNQLKQLRQKIAQKMLAGPAPGETLAAHEQTLHEWRQEQQQRETALARQIPEMNLEQQRQKVDHRAVALSLPEGVALIEFIRFDVWDFHALARKVSDDKWELPHHWQPARYLAFVLPAREPEQVQMIDLGDADPIDQMIADFRAGITTPPRMRPIRGQRPYREEDESPGEPPPPAPPAVHPIGAELRQRVFDPLRSALGEHRHLWLSPDGDLTRLPFEVLPEGAEGTLLLDRYRISYLATGRDVVRCGQPTTRQPSPALVAADPDFDLGSCPAHLRSPSASPTPPPVAKPGFWSWLFRRQRSKPVAKVRDIPASAAPHHHARRSRDIERVLPPVGRLEGTRTEGERIAALLGVKPVLDRVLDEPLKALRSPRILHLATHGFFLQDQPHDPQTGRGLDRLADANWENPLLRSGLLLAGFNTWRNGGEPPLEAEDGMLTAEDVTGMDLLNTELVVLSACKTGLGQVHVGEGVFGLRRAFAVAGARTLVMSLWNVPDEQTQELMVDFYQRILGLKGRPEGRAEALRQAQQAVRARHPDPYYWGAFICQGDPGPLTQPAG